jgi:hypothetical protein
VVALEAPRPGIAVGRITENADPVTTDVTAQRARLSPVEDLLERHDRHRLRECAVAQCGGEQPVGSLTGVRAEEGQARSGPVLRAVLDPAPRCVVGEWQRPELPLLVVKLSEQGRPGPSHLGGYRVIGHSSRYSRTRPAGKQASMGRKAEV